MAVGVAALVLAVGAAVLGSRLVTDSPPPSGGTDQAGFVSFEDKRHDLALSYPATWRRIASPDPEVALVAGNAEVSVLMRTTRLGTEVVPETLENAKTLTDRLVMKGERVKQLRPPRRIENLGGLPGWLYIYSFRDASGRRGAHAHYFLFRGKTMITMIFQTVPSESFTTYAPLFDRLAGTFKAT